MLLSAADRRLLRTLAADPRQVVTRAHLIEAVFGRDPERGSARLDLLIARLRRKVHQHCSCPVPLETAHGLGYLPSSPLTVV